MGQQDQQQQQRPEGNSSTAQPAPRISSSAGGGTYRVRLVLLEVDVARLPVLARLDREELWAGGLGLSVE